MEARHRVLVAAQPTAWAVVLRMLEDVVDLVPAHSSSDAFRVLEQDPDIDAIVCTIAFDDARMVEFLQAVKGDPEYGRIPFLCLRAFPSVLSDHLVRDMRHVCKECGAFDLLDIAKLPRDRARTELWATLESSLRSSH